MLLQVGVSPQVITLVLDLSLFCKNVHSFELEVEPEELIKVVLYKCLVAVKYGLPKLLLFLLLWKLF